MNAVRNGLRATGRAQTWELDWPARTISTPSPFNNRANNSTAAVVVEITNDQGRSIGRQTVRVPHGFEIRNTIVTPLWQWEGNVSFPAVDANLITNRLNIRIVSINGVEAETAARQHRISVMPLADWQAALQTNPGARRNLEGALVLHRSEESRRRAEEYLRNGNTAQAITAFSETLRLNSNNIMALNGRGNAHLRNTNHSQAIRDWESALRIDPNLTEARRNIETARQQQQQLQARQQQEQRQRAQAAFDQGRRNFDIRDFNRAITYFDQAIQLNRNFVNAFFWRARANFALGRYTMAHADYTQAIRLNPYDWATFHNLGLTHQRKREFNLAVTNFTQAIRLNPKSATSFASRGQVHRLSGRHNEAIVDLTESLRLRPNHAWTYNQRGLAHEGRRDYRRAFADFEAAVRLNPNSTAYNDNKWRAWGRR